MCENKFYKNKDSQELSANLVQQESSPQPEGKDSGTSKEPAEENLENRDEGEDVQSEQELYQGKGSLCLQVCEHPVYRWLLAFISKPFSTDEKKHGTESINAFFT